jgi:hypothetical protein
MMQWFRYFLLTILSLCMFCAKCNWCTWSTWCHVPYHPISRILDMFILVYLICSPPKYAWNRMIYEIRDKCSVSSHIFFQTLHHNISDIFLWWCRSPVCIPESPYMWISLKLDTNILFCFYKDNDDAFIYMISRVMWCFYIML